MSTHPAIKQAQDKVSHYIGRLDKELSKYPIAHQIEQKIQVPKAWAFIGGAAVIFLSLFINALAHPISNLLGWVLPAYLSIKAIESPGHEDDVQWLAYWVAFASFTFIESIALRMVLYYLPFYFVFKTMIILWLQLPGTKGARTLYFVILRPLLTSKGPSAANVPSPDSVSAAQ